MAPKYNTIDVHTHWIPPQWIELIEKEGAANGVRVGRNERNQVTVEIPGWSYAFPKEYTNFDIRLKAMSAARVGMHALSLAYPTVLLLSVPPALAHQLCQVYNDALSAAHLSHPEHFLGLASLPMQAPELALQELERAARLPGIRGVYIATNINGKNLDEQCYWPIYAKCEELELPVFLHPFNNLGAERLSKYYLMNFLGNGFDTAVAAACLMFGGVLDAFPKLDFVLAHAGGAFPTFIGRMDHGATVRREAKLPRPPSTYLRRFHFDTVTHSDEILMNLIRQMGADRIVLGSDHPADMSYTRPVDVVDRLTELSASDRELILHGNAARLLKL